MISVIIPIYNVQNYLERCLDSIKQQTYKDFEVIMVDDGSSDESGVIAKSYSISDSRFKYYFKQNGGLSSARNYGIEQSSGDYIVFVDSDDFVDIDYISYLVDLKNKYGTKISACWHKIYKEDRAKHLNKYTGSVVLNPEEAISNILYNDQLDTTANCKLIAKDLLSSNFFPIGKNYEDIGSIYKLFLTGESIAVGFEPKYYYYMRKDSITHESFNSKKLDLIEMTDLMADEVMKIYPNLRHAVTRRKVYSRFSTINQMLYIDKNSDFIEKRNQFIAYIKNNKSEVLNNKSVGLFDKIAIILIDLNFNLYKFVWKLYSDYFK